MINLEKSFLKDDLEEETIKNFIFESEQDNIILKNVTFENCIFKDVNFSNIEFNGVDFVNVIFENCDLSNKSFDERLLKDVLFKNCKLIGTNFIDSFIKKSEFVGVSARYINMSGTKINDMKIIELDPKIRTKKKNTSKL